MILHIQLAPKMYALFAPESIRYRVARGGRGGSKSYGFTDMALARMVNQRTDVAVCREYQSTIKKSVHKLIQERIEFHKIGKFFNITDSQITYNPNGSAFVFQHLHDNFDEVRGLEGSDICWIFEGHSLQKESFKVLRDTIRRTPRMKQDPEFWIEFNPQFEDDFVFGEFVLRKRDDCISILINYVDNPWCPDDLMREAELCKRTNYDEYRHTYMGEPRNIGGLVYYMFDPEVHIQDVNMGRIEHVGNFFMGQDPHTAYYPACVWLGRIPRGDGSFNWYWYNEFPTKSMMQNKMYWEIREEKKCALTLMQRAKMYRLMDNTVDKTYHGITIMGRGIDTRFAKGAGQASTTSNTRGIIQEMADPMNGGMVFETPPEHTIDSQRDKMRELLSYDLLIPKTAFNEPKMYVLPHCANIIDTLQFHRFDRDGKDREDDKRKDISDAMKIAMATAQMYGPVDRSIKAEQVEPEYDAVDAMARQFLGDGSFAHIGAAVEPERSHVFNPLSR